MFFKGQRYFIGFSLEDDQTVAEGRKKLRAKGLDCIVLNSSAAIGQDMIEARLLRSTGAVESLGSITKRQCAQHILETYLKYHSARKST